MVNKNSANRQIFFKSIALLVIGSILISCQSTITPTAPATDVETASTVIADIPASEATDVPPTAIITPPELPAAFQSTILNPLDTPHSYIKDTCQYLKNKWDGSNAKPGTIVMIIMIKGIYKGPVEESGGINYNDLNIIMEELKRQNFEAINTEQLLAFMEQNTYIPPRSVMIMQDGNRLYENYSEHLSKYWKDWGWPIINGWVSQPDTSEALWSGNIALEIEGSVDHQPSGVMFGTSLSDDSSADLINQELQGSIDAFTERFGKNPLAFIWQGGGFGQSPVETARKLKYQLGFTSNSRGPVMYNWVPLADKLDPARPVFIPEGKIEDPLMTLPRYWPSEALLEIDDVRAISKQAIAYAEANKKTEMGYYDIVCAPTYGQIPTP
jgi:hypothetical protein